MGIRINSLVNFCVGIGNMPRSDIGPSPNLTGTYHGICHDGDFTTCSAIQN